MMSHIARRLRLLIRSEVDLAKDQIVATVLAAVAEQDQRLSGQVRFEAGLQHAQRLEGRRFDPIHKAAHRVYSQFGEDGVIQYLLQHVPIENDLFIEFGVEDYRQSNTRFLLEKDNWRAVLIDAVPDADKFLKERGLFGWHTIDFIQSFITVGNINDLFRPYAGDIGLISIDVDGVDYFLWEALEVVSPRIVIVEYQSNFGPDLLISTPYRDDFDRTKHHYTNLCAGASLAAMVHLGNRKGYALVGSSGQHNAFFVRRDVLGDLREVSVAETYVATRYRESRDREFNNTYLTTMDERRGAMADATVIDVVTGEQTTVGKAFGLD